MKLLNRDCHAGETTEISAECKLSLFSGLVPEASAVEELIAAEAAPSATAPTLSTVGLAAMGVPTGVAGVAPLEVASPSAETPFTASAP